MDAFDVHIWCSYTLMMFTFVLSYDASPCLQVECRAGVTIKIVPERFYSCSCEKAAFRTVLNDRFVANWRRQEMPRKLILTFGRVAACRRSHRHCCNATGLVTASTSCGDGVKFIPQLNISERFDSPMVACFAGPVI